MAQSTDYQLWYAITGFYKLKSLPTIIRCSTTIFWITILPGLCRNSKQFRKTFWTFSILHTQWIHVKWTTYAVNIMFLLTILNREGSSGWFSTSALRTKSMSFGLNLSLSHTKRWTWGNPLFCYSIVYIWHITPPYNFSFVIKFISFFMRAIISFRSVGFWLGNKHDWISGH